MSKRIVKSLTMLVLGVGLALATTVASANGPLAANLVTADVPFDFIVADQTFRSGKYTVRKASDDGRGVKISSVDGKASVIRLSNLAVATGKQRNARLVFHKYGQQYFLAEIWSGDNYGRQLLKSKKERRLRHEMGTIAKGSFEVVEVAAQVR